MNQPLPPVFLVTLPPKPCVLLSPFNFLLPLIFCVWAEAAVGTLRALIDTIESLGLDSARPLAVDWWTAIERQAAVLMGHGQSEQTDLLQMQLSL